MFRHLSREGVALTYLDVIIIPAEDEKLSVNRLKRVLTVASDYGLEI